MRLPLWSQGMWMLGTVLASLALVAAPEVRPPMTQPASHVAVRLETNPIIRPGMAGLEGPDGDNINGPSLIRVPEWIDKPLGKYYLYFAHHKGRYIRLAYADKLEGPWRIHAGGVLQVKDAPGRDHIASPDLHVDPANRQIRMYFHQPAGAGSPDPGQVSFVALSKDGVNFEPQKEVLGKFYFRVFQYGGFHYAFAKNGNTDGIVYRSRDGLTNFEAGPHYLPGVRHTAMWLEGDTLRLAYSRVGEAPERLYLGTVDLRADWKQWKVQDAAPLLAPEKEYEGATLELKPSTYGPAKGALRQLRDPAIFEEDGRRYLLYSVAGEQGIAIAELKRR